VRRNGAVIVAAASKPLARANESVGKQSDNQYDLNIHADITHKMGDSKNGARYSPIPRGEDRRCGDGFLEKMCNALKS
jgi:hypothetical protein